MDSETQYIIFGSAYDYVEYMFRDIIHKDNVVFWNRKLRFRNKLIELVHNLHTSSKINHFFMVPLQKIWYSNFFDEKRLDNDKKKVFIFLDSNKYRSNYAYLKYLKKKFNAKLVLVILNTLGIEKRISVDRIKKIYDQIFTIDIGDAKKYKLEYIRGVYSRLETKNPDTTMDIIFVGNNKNRLSLLLKLDEYFDENEINHKFYINKVKDDDIVLRKNIEYNKQLSYEEVINLTQKSKAILEILQPGQDALTLRCFEAISLGKILVSNKENLHELEFYNDSQFIKIDELFRFKEILTLNKTYDSEIIQSISPLSLLNKIK